jgi:urease accessory protein
MSGLSSHPEMPPARSTGVSRRAARLHFALAGGRTALLHQHVPYPFHITRPFHLQPARADLATLYLQSASGGMYAGDDLSVTLHVAQGAAAHVTTQSATIVHDCRDAPTRLTTVATVEPDGFLALTPDPLVLFPGADVATVTELTLHEGARALVADAASLHDPLAEDRVFRRFHGTVCVRDGAGVIRLSDRGGIDGAALSGAGVLGSWRAWGTLLVLGPAALLPDPAALEAAAEAVGCLAGASAASHGLGLALRLLGPDGGTLGRCLSALAADAALSLAGCRLVSRGKEFS